LIHGFKYIENRGGPFFYEENNTYRFRRFWKQGWIATSKDEQKNGLTGTGES
jgi:hypothetical protein